MVGHSVSKGRYFYYRCRHTYSGNFEGTCDSRYVSAEPLERTVLEQIVKILADPQRILEQANNLNGQSFDESRAIRVGKELEKVEEQQAKLADL